jgi:hypothetical protein
MAGKRVCARKAPKRELDICFYEQKMGHFAPAFSTISNTHTQNIPGKK